MHDMMRSSKKKPFPFERTLKFTHYPSKGTFPFSYSINTLLRPSRAGHNINKYALTHKGNVQRNINLLTKNEKKKPKGLNSGVDKAKITNKIN